MKCVVTGAAGFIGSHLCQELLLAGHDITGVDAFVPGYPQIVKQRNVLCFLGNPRCRFYRIDLCNDPLDLVVADAELVFHLAGIPEVTSNWREIDSYWANNVVATRRLLDAVANVAGGIKRFIYASSSSVYGKLTSGDESQAMTPVSPDGMTKLTAEHMCRAYGIPVVTLRYFAIYGPRQRPDLEPYGFIQALLLNQPVVIHGHNEQICSNCYIDDCVQATIAAADAPAGEILNVGSNESATVEEVVGKLEALVGRRAMIKHGRPCPGEWAYAVADTARIRKHLGWRHFTTLNEGLAKQWEWQKKELARKESAIGGHNKMKKSVPQTMLD
jgi:nucleoside-diphosphate-sugar epimerase